MRWIRIALVTMHLALAGSIAAEPARPARVLVFSDSQDRDGFIGALRIQLAGQAEVVSAGPLHAATLSDRFRRSGKLVRDNEASLAVWFDRNNDGSFLLYAVGSRGDRGLIEVGRIGAEDSETNRILALKVSALVDELIATPAAASVLAPPVTKARVGGATPLAAKDHAAQRASQRIGALISFGALGTFGSGQPNAQLGALVGVGAQRRVERVVVGAEVSGAWHFDRELENSGGRAQFSERAIGLRGTVAVMLRSVELGGQVGATLRRFETRATANDGTIGSSTATIPTLELGVFTRVQVTKALAVEFGLPLTVATIAEELTLRGDRIAAIGRVRVSPEIRLVLRWP